MLLVFACCLRQCPSLLESHPWGRASHWPQHLQSPSVWFSRGRHWTRYSLWKPHLLHIPSFCDNCARLPATETRTTAIDSRILTMASCQAFPLKRLCKPLFRDARSSFMLTGFLSSVVLPWTVYTAFQVSGMSGMVSWLRVPTAISSARYECLEPLRKRKTRWASVTVYGILPAWRLSGWNSNSYRILLLLKIIIRIRTTTGKLKTVGRWAAIASRAKVRLTPLGMLAEKKNRAPTLILVVIDRLWNPLRVLQLLNISLLTAIIIIILRCCW